MIAGIEPKHELFYSCESINGCKNEAYKVADLSIEVSTTHERYDVTNVFIIPRLSAGKRAMRRILEGNSHLRGRIGYCFFFFVICDWLNHFPL